MENWDIPYFEGMQSVKMPTLKSVGKNLFDGVSYIDGFITSGNNYTVSPDTDVSSILVNVNKNTDYILSAKTTFSRSIVGGSLTPISIGTKTTNLNSERVGNTIKFNSGIYTNIIIYLNETKIDIEDIQVEEGSVATPYEPYKSNILSTSEDIELRGIDEVRDELNVLTGEKIERISKIVLDGSEETWDNNYETTNTMTFRLPLPNKYFYINQWVNTGLKNDCGFEQVGWFYIYNDKVDKECYGVGDNNNIYIRVLKSRLNSVDVNGFKSFLSTNPITIQYVLATESIKTVDLMPSGTHPSTTPYCWKNGHIQLSSSGLLPNLEYSVVTSRAGQINQNATMIVKNDKRIFDLEILLAGGLVNTTYQALTLQNQVETGLSKVSLNSETEPDYLLYHMIMKLIEEKAYKLDDLTEKVSVFYLYEKLSDEQFETIYSALYPFVEDEIVEEPVVEELPEVVEDEVIM